MRQVCFATYDRGCSSRRLDKLQAAAVRRVLQVNDGSRPKRVGVVPKTVCQMKHPDSLNGHQIGHKDCTICACALTFCIDDAGVLHRIGPTYKGRGSEMVYDAICDYCHEISVVHTLV